MLLVLLFSGLAALPWTAMAQTSQVVGLVYECGDRTTFVDGATVTLTDANGVQPTATVATGADGTFRFTPSPGYYNITARRTGYFAFVNGSFDDGTTAPFRFDGLSTVRKEFCLDATPTADKTLTVRVLNDATSAPVGNATVDVYFAPRGQVVASSLSNVTTGNASFVLWGATFELRTAKAGFRLNVTTVDTSAVTTKTVRMEGGIRIVGHARDSAGNFISAGLQAHLYDLSPAAEPAKKVVRGEVVGSLYTFRAFPGATYRMVVDANGFKATTTTIGPFTANPPSPINSVLAPSVREEYRTTVLFGTADWSNLTLHRNLTLNPDTTFPGLSPTGLRDLRLQVDLTLGSTKDGVVSAAENAAFLSWLRTNGPLYTTTDGFFTTNGKAYLSSASLLDYQVTVDGLLTPGSRVWINTTATYGLKALPYIALDAQRYFVNATTMPDKNESVYQDQVYEVVLPRRYEMASSAITGPLTTDGFTRVVVDPGVATVPPQIRMTVELSQNGTARAKVAGPAGRFHVVNASFESYRAFVANNTTLTLSAEDSTDPVGDITKANFTWRPYANATGTLADVKVFGIRPTFAYNRSGEFVVNLSVVEAGGNETFRTITLWVDDTPPVARIRTNRTGTAPVTNTTILRINEDVPVRFDGAPSSDQAFANRPQGGNRTGAIPDGGYAWDFDGDGITDATSRIVNRSFEKPGNYTVNLTVTDGVGHKSTNASLRVIVNDTTKPAPAFDILDPRNEWDITTTLTENLAYAFNASRTSDNLDSKDVLNYTWTIPGPISVGGTPRPGTNNTLYGMNITFTWTEFNSSYEVVLKVADTGFGSGTKNTGELRQRITVALDLVARPNLRVVSNTFRVQPTDPEDGAVISASVNVTNLVGRGTAESLTTELFAISGGVTTTLTTSSTLWNADGSQRTNGTIAPGETVTIKFEATVVGQGNKTIRVRVSDTNEAWTQRGPENEANTSINVRQSTLQTIAFYGAIVGVLALFVFAMIYRRKVRAGDWQPIRLRRREKAEGEEKRPRREVKEEKKRL